MGRRRCWSGAVAAAFALLLLAPSPAFATTRATLLLIKTHHPTSAMLQCFCELAAEVIASRHNSAVFILATRTSRCTAGRCTHASSPRAAFEAAGCGARQELVDVSTEAWLARRPFNATHGFAVGLASLYPVTEYLDVLQELNWFDTNRAREFDYVWARCPPPSPLSSPLKHVCTAARPQVLEQDVAWSGGRLLPVLAAAGAGPGADGADVVCTGPETFIASHSDTWFWWSAHSGWVEPVAPAAKLHRTHTYTVSWEGNGISRLPFPPPPPVRRSCDSLGM